MLENEELIFFVTPSLPSPLLLENRVGKRIGVTLSIFLLVLLSFRETLAPPALKTGQPKNRASLWRAENLCGGGDPASHSSVIRGICLQKKILETTHIFPDSLCNVVTAKH